MGLRWGRWGVVSMVRDISGCVFRVLTGVFDLAAFGPTMFWGDCVHIRFCGNGGLGFRPYGESLWQTPQRNQRSRPSVRPLAEARRSFVPVSIWGHRLRSASLRPPLDVFDCVERRCAPTPQMNTSTQPAEGAGGSRSRAAGELTLGLLSGEKRKAYAGEGINHIGNKTVQSHR
jgi:hypothetical protein